MSSQPCFLPHPLFRMTTPLVAGLVPAPFHFDHGTPCKARPGILPAFRGPVYNSSHRRHNLPARQFPPQIRDAPRGSNAFLYSAMLTQLILRSRRRVCSNRFDLHGWTANLTGFAEKSSASIVTILSHMRHQINSVLRKDTHFGVRKRSCPNSFHSFIIDLRMSRRR